MKDRLAALLKAADESSASRCITGYDEAVADNAEYLLANGVIAPPVKIGQTVYPLHADCRFRAFVERIEQTANGIFFDWVQYDVGVDAVECYDEERFDVGDIGKTVFLDEMEYLRALLMEKGTDNGK